MRCAVTDQRRTTGGRDAHDALPRGQDGLGTDLPLGPRGRPARPRRDAGRQRASGHAGLEVAATALQVPFGAVDPFTHGIPVEQALAMAAPHVDERERRRVGFEILRRQADPDVPVVLLPGAGSLTTHLGGTAWGIVTSGDLQLARASMSKAGVPPPPVLVTADDVAQGKPHPEPFLRAAELLGVPPEDCLVIEDSPAGIHAGKKAGMPVVAVATSHDSWRLDQADQVIRSLECLSLRGS